MALTESNKRKIEEEEKYRRAVAATITDNSHSLTQKHGVPLLLSIFIPGLGQLVKGQVKKGLLIFFAPIAVFFFLFFLSFLGGKGSDMLALLGNLWFGSIILYIWQLIDAYNN
jgi:hypothetical protein